MKARSIIIVVMFALVVLVCPDLLRAQDSPADVHALIDQVTAGNVDEAKSELPSLKEKSPDDPGVIYLEALLTTDGSVAARLYQSIVDNHPRCEWADAALYKVYQFYYSLGLYKTADIKMAQLQRDYPDSKYLKGQGSMAESVPVVTRHDTPSAPAVTPPVAAPPKEEPGETSPKTETSLAVVKHLPPPIVKQNPPSAKQEKPATVVHQSSGGFTLQVGAFASEPNAERLQRAVQAMGYSVEIVTRGHTGKPMYHVWVGNYPTEADARAAAVELREKHSMDAMLVTR
jgi:cell division septation protein DedD